MIFRTAFMFEGKRAADVLIFLSAVGAMNVEGPVPVQNVTTRNGKVFTQTATGNASDIVLKQLTLRKAKYVSKSTIAAILTDASFKSSSAGYVINQLVKSDHLKTTKSSGVYQVMRKS